MVYMPCSVHKVLIHGCEVINYFELPIGTLNINFLISENNINDIFITGSLSEEALEANHKFSRSNRLSHTKKIAGKIPIRN